MSIRIKAGEKVIFFTGNNAVLCELRSGWDLDFMDLEDEWTHQLDSELDSEEDHIYYLRVNDSGKNLKVLYFEALSWENGSYETFCLDPVVVWLANDSYYEGTVLQDSYPFRIDVPLHHDDDKLKLELANLHQQYRLLLAIGPCPDFEDDDD